MATMPDRTETALLVIDVQNAVVGDAHNRDDVVRTIGGLVERARDSGTPVVWVQHSDDDAMPRESDGWRIVDELRPADGEAVVHKRYGDSFEDTELEDVLAAARVGRLVVTGAETDACIRCTLHGAFTRGYDTQLVGDAHTTGDKRPWVPELPSPEQVIAHTNLYWGFQAAPGRTAGTVDSANVTF